MPASHSPLKVSAIIPARNEEHTISALVKALVALQSADGEALLEEVLVADNGSTDRTASLALAAGARVIFVARPGYGQACWEASHAAVGDVLLYVDGDGAADPADAAGLIADIEEDVDLVIGLRLAPERGAMTWPQQLGNRLTCALIRLLWRAPVHDLGPYRAVRKSAFDVLAMTDRGYGWTVEMQVRAHTLGLRTAQRPVQWHARAGGHSKISGTVCGVIGAGMGMLGMIYSLWRSQRQSSIALAVPVSPTAIEKSG